MRHVRKAREDQTSLLAGIWSVVNLHCNLTSTPCMKPASLAPCQHHALFDTTTLPGLYTLYTLPMIGQTTGLKQNMTAACTCRNHIFVSLQWNNDVVVCLAS